MKIVCCFVILALCGAVSLGSFLNLCPKQMDCSNDGVAKIISCNYTKTTPILHNPTWKVNGSDVESRDYTTSIELNDTHYITNLNYSSFPVGVHKVALKYNLKGPIVVCEDIAVRYTATVVVAAPLCKANVGKVLSRERAVHINRIFKNILARMRIEQKVDLELEDTSPQSG